MTTIVLVFKNIESKDKIMYGNLYSSSKGETITNENDIDNVLQSIYTTIIEQVLVSGQPKDLNWYDGLRYFLFACCSERH